MKIFMFTGFAMFTNGLWEPNLVIYNRKEVTEEEVPIQIPALPDGQGGIIGKVPRFPEEGMNEIEGWIFNEDEEKIEDVLEKFSEKFGEIHNVQFGVQPKDLFLQFLEGLRDTLKSISERMERENSEETEVKEIEEKHDHPTDN